ncbi:hypothetical protein [uncultured Roseibium sp.]
MITTEAARFAGVQESGVGNEGSRYGLDGDLNVTHSCIGGLGL